MFPVRKKKATRSFFTLKHVETHAHPLATQNQQIQIAFLALMHLLLIIISPCHQHKHIAGFPPQLYWRQLLSLSPAFSWCVSLSLNPPPSPLLSLRLPLELKANYSPQIRSNISLHHSLINSARARKIKFILNSIKGKLSVLCGFPYTFGCWISCNFPLLYCVWFFNWQLELVLAHRYCTCVGSISENEEIKHTQPFFHTHAHTPPHTH